MNINDGNKRVVVSMSGGVDSSVAALLLKEKGYDVIGITMKLADGEENSCCSLKDIDDARRACQKIDIPHYILNFKEYFKKDVINYFINEYVDGRTPNPCIYCNNKIKFHHLLNYCKKLDCNLLATGHYANINKINGKYKLLRGKDKTKDQSYFLFSIPKNKLKNILFPLGEYLKSETRAIAKKFGLKNFEKKESEDLCFVLNSSYAKYIDEKYKPSLEGFIKNKNGEIIKRHDGIHNFTIGQRKGLKISSSKPLFVIKIDKKDNSITVGEKEDLFKNNFYINKCNWFMDEKVSKKFKGEVQIRYGSEPVSAFITVLNEKRAKIDLFEEALSVTPGQACVVYNNTEVLGGGWIE